MAGSRVHRSRHINVCLPQVLEVDMKRFASSIGLFALMVALAGPFSGIASGASQAQMQAQGRFFSETGHGAYGWFWRFWQNTPDALRILGYPLSEPFVQESFTEPGTFYRVQYFERAVLEEHPENFGRDDNRFYILGRLLGNEIVRERRDEAPFQPVAQIPLTADQVWFPETGHTLRNDPVRGPFKAFWEQYGGLVVFGFPVSEPFQERNPDTGETYWVQYFERNRFEFQPQQPADFRVLLGRLGAQYAATNPDRVRQDAFRPRAEGESLPEPFFYGTNVAAYYTDRDRLFRSVKDLLETNNETGGPAWIRQQVPWSDHMNQDGSIAWGNLDLVVNEAAARNVRIMLSITRSPAWATDNRQHGMPNRANFPRFASFMYAIAERYRGRVHAIQIWNEQNYAVENGGRVAPASYYVDLLAAGYDAIKAADPNMIVVAGAPTPTATNNPDIAIDDIIYFQEMFALPTFWAKSDVVGAHFAGTLQPADALPGQNARPEGWNNNSEFFFRRAEDLRAAMLRAGRGDRQVWITEFGWATPNNTLGYEYGNYNTFETQAQNIVRALELGRWTYTPWVGAMFIWNHNFAVTWGTVGNPMHEQASFGVLNPDWSPRPAYNAVRDMPKR
jgi:polysaccharide biosynthesis protein PslG